MRVSAVESGVMRALEATGRNCWSARVSVRYRHGLDLSVEGVPQPIFVSTAARGLFPSHLAVSADVLEALLLKPVGSRLTLGAIDGELCDDASALLLPARRFDLRLRLDLDEPIIVSRLQSRTVTFERMLGLVAGAGGLDPFDVLLSDAWSHRDAFLSGNGMRQAMVSLLGCGRGSTPAGDDMLVGAASACRALAGTSGETGDRARTWLGALAECRPMFAERTTLMSCGYLNAALDGVFGSHLIALHKVFWGLRPGSLLSAMLRVKRHGSTSGADALAGVCLGYRYLSR